MAAASIPTTSGTEQNFMRNTPREDLRHPTVEELLLQIENHLYKSVDHRTSLLIAVWSCLAGRGYFRNIEKVFGMLYRESAMTIFCGHWPKVGTPYKRGLARALIQFSHTMGHFVKGSDGLCSALVMAAYDPWGDSVFHHLLSRQETDQNLVTEFIKSEPFELLLIRIECLVNAHFEDAAIRLCRSCLQNNVFYENKNEDCNNYDHWRWTFMEWLLRLLFRKRRLNDLIAESAACSCHDGVRLIYRTRSSQMEDSGPLTETLINLFLVRDLLFQSNYCCTSELMKLWCEFQVQNQRSVSEIQEAAQKLLVGHASSSAQFYLFVDILWEKFGTSLIPLYLEMYIRGLTSDLNYLETARQADNKEYVIEIENHMAAMYFKLSTMFTSINKEISLECMLSSFSLDPTKERLDWIKKLSLQISKEKALKAAASRNEACKHKLCNKSGYPHKCTQSNVAKKKSVVMCDQAIQVGDESFGGLPEVSYCSSGNDQNACTTVANCVAENRRENSNDLLVDKQHINSSAVSGGINQVNEKENFTKAPNSISATVHKDGDHNFNQSTNSPCTSLAADNIQNQIMSGEECKVDTTKAKVMVEAADDKNKENIDVVPEIMNNENKTNLQQNKGPNKCVSNDHIPQKVSVSHNGDISEESEGKTVLSNLSSETAHDCDTLDVGANLGNEKISGSNNCTEGCNKDDSLNNCAKVKANNKAEKNDCNVSHLDNCDTSDGTSAELKCVSDSKSKCEDSEKCINKDKNIVKQECISSLSSCDQESPNNHETDNPSQIINGPSNHLTIENSVVPNEAGENAVTHKMVPKENFPVCNISSDPDISKDLKPTEIPNKPLEILYKTPARQVERTDPEKIKNTDTCSEIELSEKNPACSVNKKVDVLAFSHIVLDFKNAGFSSELLSDFVIVLESLRNKQLKSSSKWSQIKHLCEDYLETTTNKRCMILNMQLNGSVDSEADSASEMTAFKDFESHQSNDSVVEDHYADKSHVFKRFMNADTDMATYVNLSDIHCPQIPLEKLFYTDHSSSHMGHKKRHKKHRNHDKNPEKVVLRKLRHGSRAERELVKRKKRKKRKGKRAKGHAKKHHFTHGKITKDYLKNKKKKHRLKKKKDGNSGFISGDYCSDFSSAELMRLVKEHSNSYSKMPASTSKHPHPSGFLPGVSPSMGSSDVTDEPSRKKRKVTFDKKKEKTGKCHDKHKHEKSKSSKRKKKIVVESCKASLKNMTSENPVARNVDSVNDYSQILQFSSVKKMEAVQIRRRSVALNLSEVSKVNREREKIPMVSQCQSHSQLQQLVQQNFESCSPEDLMKMQLLMSRQQPDVSAMSSSNQYDKDFISSPNNQAVLKYVCSKMTSHLLSVAQSSNCIVGSDSDTSKSPTPIITSRAPQMQTSSKSHIQPQNLSSNIKHVIIERNSPSYKLSNNAASVTGSTLIPVNAVSCPTSSDSHNLIGTVLTSGIAYPAGTTSPQVTTFTIPVAHSSGNKLVTSKIVIPVNQCSSMRGASSSLPLVESEAHTFASTSNSQPLSGVIIVKNGNNTQIISGSPQSCNVMPCLPTSRVQLPTVRSKNTVISKTVPKIIKQAAKKLSQPQVKKSVLKTSNVNAPVFTSNNKVTIEPSVVNTKSNLDSGINKSEVLIQSEKSLFSQKAITDLSPNIREPQVLPSVQEEISSEKISSNDESSNAKNVDEGVKAEATKIGDPNTSSTSTPDIVQPASSPSEPIDLKSPEISVSNNTNTISDSPQEEKPKHTEDSPVIGEEPKENKDDVIISDSVSNADVTQNSEPPEIKTDEVKTVKMEDSVEKPSVPSTEMSDKVDLIIGDAKSPITKDTNSVTTNIAVIRNESSDVSNVAESDVSNITSNILSDEKSALCSIDKTLNSSDQQKQLQPITIGSIASSVKASGKGSSQGKIEGGSQSSEVPTRSFTSISDAVRFSLMDMDDATDSVENQVLHAFQVSHESSPDSPRYDTSTNGAETITSSPSAVILTTPQSTSTTELNVSRVSQRFERSVHSAQNEKFTECQSTVSRTTTWILEDSSINETSQAIAIQKTTDIDSSGETKDDDKPRKKRKRKERSERDPDAAHKFWCEICHKGFFSAYNLRRHCRNVHKMDLPKGSSDVPFPSSSQCLPHIQQTESSPEGSSARMAYGSVQPSCVSPKGSEFMLQSPTREAKTQDFTVKASPNQHASQIQNSEFSVQTPPRIPSQSSSAHVSPVTPPKDFRLPTPTTVPPGQISQSKLQSASKSATSPKFQRLPTPCATSQVPQLTKISQMQPIPLCGQPALQQQRQVGQLQSSGLIQPLPSVACQAQQIQQPTQCPHFQANKQIVQHRINQLQLMHHVGQLPSVQHTTHGIQKQTQVQQFKKCSTSQQTTKMTETEQIQQAAQLAQNQQILANQQMQKLIQIRQNAIAASGVASQLSLNTTVPVQNSPNKTATQCFQSQLAAARQAAVAAQLPAGQRTQGTNYNLPSHEASGHQFFNPSLQPNQEQSNCPHSSFGAQNISEFSSSAPSYPTIRLSSETNDGLEDLEQFLLENMPWSGDQSASHGLAQQPGNRPSSADSLTLSIPSQLSGSSQNRSGMSVKNKTSITRPKPRKPIATPCSKNLLGNLGRGVKKKSCPKKIPKPPDSDCSVSKSEMFSHASVHTQLPHETDALQKQCSKNNSNNLLASKQGVKSNVMNSMNETDSSDSVQCINISPNPPSKNASVGINFNTFPSVNTSTSDKSTSAACSVESSTSKETFDIQSKNSFLDNCNLISKSCTNVNQNKTTINNCETNLINTGSAFNLPGKDTACDVKTFCQTSTSASAFGDKTETSNSQDIFLGQRNSESCDLEPDVHKSPKAPDSRMEFVSTVCTDDISTTNCKKADENNVDLGKESPVSQPDLFLGDKSKNSSAHSENCKNTYESTVEVNCLNQEQNKVNDDDDVNIVSSSTAVECKSPCINSELENKENSDNVSSTEENYAEKSPVNDQKLISNNEAISDNESNSSEINNHEEHLMTSEENISSDDVDVKENIQKNLSESQNCYSESTDGLDATKSIVNNCNEKINSYNENGFSSQVENDDEHSSHENQIPNDENHLPKKNEEINGETISKRIALRIRKSPDVSNKINENDKNVKYYVTEKTDDMKVSVVKKFSQKKKKIKQENRKLELSETKKVPYHKYDNESTIQKTNLLNSINDPFNDKDENRTMCLMTPCYKEIEKMSALDDETHENEESFCLDEKQLDDSCIDEIPSGRLRLRDTPKTSVKRVCPCCVDSRMPKRCRANGGSNVVKMIGTRLPNAMKNKSTLKTRNTTNGHNVKVNTRSSQRLRSRNNTLS